MSALGHNPSPEHLARVEAERARADAQRARRRAENAVRVAARIVGAEVVR